ncbi:MAG: DUF6716 putative glycosyltransferase [Propioniciclava sp.]
MSPSRQALFVADSDSYLKWAVQRLHDLPDAWDVELVIVQNAVTPSTDQQTAALDGRLRDTPPTIALDVLVDRLRSAPPDLLFLACRGPLIQVLLLHEFHGTPPATVVAAGIPGIWFPPTKKGIRLRRAVDMLVVHSHRERREVVQRLGPGRIRQVGLASLARDIGEGGESERPRVVFAPQALVPRTEAERLRIVDGLIAAANTHPDLDVVIKLRGTAEEAQTHAEFAAFPDLVHRYPQLPANLTFGYGPLREFLGNCRGFVTVSSTAALEAIEAQVPVLLLADFGIGSEQINKVFDGSGLFGSLGDLATLNFHDPHPAWLADNYFHPLADDDWVQLVEDQIKAGTHRDRGEVAVPTSLRSLPYRLEVTSEALGEPDDTYRRLAYRTLRHTRRLARRLRARGREAWAALRPPRR